MSVAGDAGIVIGGAGGGLNQAALDAHAADTTSVHGLTETRDASIEVVFDGGGAALTTGVKGDIEVPFPATILAVRLVADQAGDVVIDIWKDTYANFPPVNGDSITASAPPTLSGAAKSEDATLTGWTTSLAKGDWLRFNVDSAATLTRVTLSLTLRRT